MIFKEDCGFFELCPFQILKYLIIYQRCETAGVSKGALLEGQLVISIEALNSKHQANTLHCVTTIAAAGSIYGGLVLKKLLEDMQSVLPGFFANLNWTSEEAGHSQDASGLRPFQMIFEADVKPRTLMTDSLVIKNFLRKIITVPPKIRFNFSVKVNGILSVEIFGAESEPALNLSNGIALVVNCQHYLSTPKFDTTELPCSRIHPVLGHPVMLFIPDDVVGMGLLGELTLTPAVALCPCPKVFSNQLNRISSISIFLYGPSGLPLIFPNSEQPTTAVFKDASYFIDWKKYRLSMVPNLDLSLDSGSVLPDVSYQVESGEGDQSHNMGPQGQTVLLFLFVDFHRGFPGQKMELWGVHTLLSAHLRAILRESHSVVQGCIQAAVAWALEQHRQAVKAHQKLQASLSVAVDSIMSIMTGSTNSSFRKTCLQTLQAADTQEFGTKLHKSFQEVTQHRFLYHCSHEVKQLLPERNEAEQNTDKAHENGSLELLAGTGEQTENKRLKRGSLGVEETRASRSAGALSPSEAASRRAEPTAAPLTFSRSRTGPGSGLEDAGPSCSHKAALHQCPGGVKSLAPLRATLEGTYRHPGTSLLTLMGFRLEGIFPAALLPLLLTMILFLGPLMQLSMDCPCDLADGLKVVLAPRSWARCLTDMRWLRNQVIAPLTEELVFRACMLPMLAPCTGLGPAVFTCPLFFGVAHFHHIFEQLRFRQSSVGSIFLSAAFQFSYTAVFGAYTAFLFIRTGHLIGPVLCHSFCNYMGFPAVCAALEHPQRRPLLAGYALGVGLFLLLLQPLTDPKLYGSLPLCVLLERAGDSEAPLCS
ncbi:PREDICTED: type 2 DNA topoisomerase 6 subunit B-like isoform X2 [Capra hircus]|uniref:type 2 DNA topoisomerase 6 subunit B-like isoform X2 n=1 Tax=Capra hircus TaxID=9925 RepID=UPI000847C1B8|nr:PREDICTED: type 2 DNA topoisomerase 6 subunit B-like isoform X2 [Capra hircus]